MASPPSARDTTSRPLRILLGTVEIAGMLPEYATGFRRLGHSVTTAVRHLSPWHLDLEYDVDLRNSGIRWPDFLAESRFPPFQLVRGTTNRAAHLSRLARLIAAHDVFVFQWESLSAKAADYPWIRRLGKKVVTLFVGSEVRHWPTFCDQIGLDACLVPEYDRNGSILPQLQRLRWAERHSDLILAQPNYAGLALRPYRHNFVPIDLADLPSKINDREAPLVVHAPSKEWVKGTKRIVQAIEDLRSEGIPFDFRLLSSVPNREVLKALCQADVAIDQLYLPMHGRFGVEAMACGCALATRNDEHFEPFPPDRPIWQIDSSNLKDALRELLTNRALRLRLARDGRRYVEDYHDCRRVAQRILEGLQGEQWDHFPSHFARDFRCRLGQELPPRLKRLTLKIIQQWGLPEDVADADLVSRGLI